MKILSSTQVQHSSENSAKKEKKLSKKGNEIAGVSTGGRKIVKRDAPSQSMSTDQIRDKIEKMKLKKIAKANVKKVEKKHFSSEMPSTKEIKAERLQEEKRKKLEIAKKAAMSKTAANSQAKTESQAETKAAAKTENKTEAKTDAKAEKQTAKVVDASGNPIKSDVSKNDPTDPNVREKLKEILSTGAFSFNQKEKGALAAILNTEA